jgi:hypothetical protein
MQVKYVSESNLQVTLDNGAIWFMADDAKDKLDRFGVQEWIDEGNTPEPYVEPELSYSVRRAAAYASLQEQADMQYWDAVNGTTLWQEHIAKVKSDIPKE